MDVFCEIRHGFGLSFIKEYRAKAFLAILCLLPLPIYNVAVNGACHITFGYVILMIGVSLVEEVVFRGVLVFYTKKLNKYFAMLINGFIFGAAHFVNLLGNADIYYTAVQCLCAFVVGMALYSLRLHFQSIIPCILLHFLVNVTGNGDTRFDFANLIIIATIGIYYIIYGFYMCNKSNNFGRTL